ncbi:MAG TPA: PfkB family carbohydrate kinase [Saprospiraceae bacterium]|nr:PfkB family carbohydrate kinase [Saprospiraceae bacterium]
MNPYKIAILGPIPRDHITTSRGQVIEKYGCVTHPTIGLARLLEGKGIVTPITHTTQQDEPGIRQLLGAYANIDLSGIYTYHNQGDVVRLRFLDQNNRIEKQTGFMPPIAPADVQPFLDYDAFVCVPISDYEVPLQTLQYIKAQAKPDAVILFDAHGPTTTVTTTGDRLRRFWVERDLWLPYIDVLKMNIEEAGCSWFKAEYNLDELDKEHQELSEDAMAAFADHVLQQGVKALYITLDARGCMLYTRQADRLQALFIPSVRVEEVIDTTGCGDSFAGGLAFGLLEDRQTYERAAWYANALGARRTQGTTFEVFWPLGPTQDLIRRNYGAHIRV